MVDKFDSKKIYKIVVRENNSSVKTLRGYIVDSDDTYVTLKFINEDTRVFVNHNSIITIMEVVSNDF